MKYFNKTSLSLGLVVVFGYLSMFNGSGSHSWNGGRTNAPFDNGTCSSGGTGCHATAGSFNPTTTLTLLSGTNPVTTYTSNTNYTLRITITSSGTSSSTRYGFQAVSVKAGSPYAPINNWGTMPAGTKKSTNINSRAYASHSTSNFANNVINIPWTSPATTTGNITFYAAGLVSNKNNNQSGDNVATTSLTISPASSGCTTPTLTPSITHVDCFDGQTGAINVNAVGGTTPISYDWSGPGGYTASTKDIANIKAGQYRLIVTANGGCKDTINPLVNQSPKLSVNTNVSSPYCAGTNVSIKATASGGSGSYMYDWTDPNGGGGSFQTITVNNIAATDTGDYIAKVTDIKNCSINDTINVQVDSLPIAAGIIVDTVSQNTYKFTADNPRYIDNVLWEFGDGKTATTPSATNTYTSNGTYEVKLTMTNHCGNNTLKVSQNIWPQSIQDNKLTTIEIYPNPADGTVRITNRQKINIQGIRIMSLQGALIFETDAINQKRIDINTSPYANGVYILHIIHNNQTYTYPLSIRH